MSNKIVKAVNGFLKTHQETLLTGAIIASTVVAVYSAVKCTPKCMQILDELHDAPALEKTKKILPVMAPTIAATGASIGLTVLSHKLTSEKITALASAYSVAKTMKDEYEDKTKEIVGEEKAKEIERAALTDRANRISAENSTVEYYETVDSNDGEKMWWILEPITGKEFRASKASIVRVVNWFNGEIIDARDQNDDEFDVTIADIFKKLGLNGVGSCAEMFGVNALEDGILNVNLDGVYNHVDSKGEEPGYIMEFSYPKMHLIPMDQHVRR